MTSSNLSPKPRLAHDGRRLRGTRSRDKIIAAVMKLLRSGSINPTTAQIAATAKVSLRTVFRHFDDKDSLYEEMTVLAAKGTIPSFAQSYAMEGWQARLIEMISRRADVYEEILPIKVTANVRRFRSEYLMDVHDRFLALERYGLEHFLPAETMAEAPLFDALQLATSFDAWCRLRREQGLSIEAAKAALNLTVSSLIKDCDPNLKTSNMSLP